jgi:hypothetical protein
MTHATQTCMTVHDLDLLSKDNVSENREKRKDSREGRFSVYNQEWDMIDLETIGKIPHACSAFVGVCNYYNLMAAIDELGRELVDVTFNAAGLGEKEVADHGDVVRHLDETL